jgi:hypothetical protein
MINWLTIESFRQLCFELASQAAAWLPQNESIRQSIKKCERRKTETLPLV